MRPGVCAVMVCALLGELSTYRDVAQIVVSSRFKSHTLKAVALCAVRTSRESRSVGRRTCGSRRFASEAA
jgi:hypothetical protein